MSDRPRLRPDVELRRLDDRETLLYDPESDSVHVLNSTAALIATLCDGRHTAEEMATEIRRQFEVQEDADVLLAVRETLVSLNTQRLLQS